MQRETPTPTSNQVLHIFKSARWYKETLTTGNVKYKPDYSCATAIIVLLVVLYNWRP